jgi:hypothetical protein
MAEIRDHVDIQAILQTANVPRASFGLGLFLVDDDQIPIDTRFRYTTKTSFSDDFTSGTVPHDYSNVYFAQKRTPDKLMIGRWAKVATAPFFVSGPGYETDYLAWKAITTGAFKITDSGANSDDVTGLDFSTITALSQILGILNAALAALVGPNVVGLDSASFSFDSLGRLVLTMPTAGASEPTISMGAPGSGTDISETHFDASNGSSPAGVDAEEPGDAIDEISDLDNSWYNLQERGTDDTQKEDLATKIEALEKLYDLVSWNPDAKNPAVSTDIGSVLKALGTKRTLGIYTEHSDQYPDSAFAGAVLPAEEGTTSFAYEALTLVTDSGLNKPLTVSERIALADKGYCWIETVGETYLYDGITLGNEEKRIMLGRDWFVARIAEDIFADQLNSPLNSFDNDTLAKIEGIIRNRGEQAITRKIIVNTPARPFTVDLPDADDIDQVQRDTHELEQYDVFQAYLNSAINDYKIVGTWTR